MASWREFNQNLQLQWQRSTLAQRWQGLPARDRLALLALSLFLLLVLFYLLLWQPAQRHAQAARAAFEEQRALYAYLQSRAPEVRGRDLQPRSSPDPARLQGLVTASAAEQGLVIERLDGEGQGAVQVSLQPAAFAQLLRWIELLEGQGIRVEELGLDRREENQVAARLSLRVGG
ncbi:type II secretion system protein M [Ectopseudomonas hydrolytica]|jgi:general secretion pathway protein M|uniref:Type II secretion system protein M n=1 Tax=Ectopseudomonas hydrolytica TaxID=2493633 RepID=A0ABY5ACV7_9GAMM|nr:MULTISPECIES: type II secretion system protein M [Pseudomonas]ARS48330.1 general secretion pathway protein GspM [Pseudomonas mendocina]EJO93574.1 general secretion pathway protein M [Pseudomonas mendocina DLHK]ATH82922.1 type II secretion system protein M [Pseudomonas mendocina]MBA4245809.1 preprotein translocase subunit YajC [Pseudomonas sp.]MDH0098399.1 type II secretion system protein M [Pseudomonas sp. GD04158]